MADREMSVQEIEVVSPELALVDPALATRARLTLADPGEVPLKQARVELEPLTPTVPRSRPAPDLPDRALQDHDPRLFSPASPEVDAGAAVRRLVESAAEDVPSSARKRRRTELLVLVPAPALAAIVFLFASARLETPAEPPSSSVLETSAEVTEAGPPIVSRSPVAPLKSSPTRAPRKPAGRVAVSRDFAWAPTANASGYHVELYRGSSRVFAADTTDARIALPATWIDDGRKQQLIPGEYRWFVWPIVNGTRATSATVQATLTVASL